MIGCQRSSATWQIKKKHGGRSGRRRRVFFSFGPEGILFPTKSKIAPWSYGKTLYTPRHPPLQALLSTDWNTPLSSLREIHCRIYTFWFRFRGLSSSSPCKRPKQSGKRSLPTEKELSRRHLCLHTTDQSYAQDSANLQQYVLLRNKLVTQLIIRATESFNLHCNNVARQVEEKCCQYYRTLTLSSCQDNTQFYCNHIHVISILFRTSISFVFFVFIYIRSLFSYLFVHIYLYHRSLHLTF